METPKTHLGYPAHVDKFFGALRDMYEKHADEIDDSVEASPKKRKTLIMRVNINKSGTWPAFTPHIKMEKAEPIQDSREVVCDDPDQGMLFEPTTEAPSIEPPPEKKKRGKKKEAA